MTSVTAFVEDCPTTLLTNLTLSHQEKMKSVEEERENGDEGEMNAAVVMNDGVCAICLDCIELQETALVKGCEHAYCVNCILQWATYHEHPKCPQCKHPFESLSVHRALDGTLRDYLLEESVCLLVRASWFKPLVIEHHNDPYDDDDFEDLYFYQYGHRYDEEEEDDLHEAYFGNSSSSTLRLGNRRWGDNGYVRAGRQEARPVQRSNPNPNPNPNPNSGSSSSRQRKKKQQVEWEDLDASGSSHGPGPGPNKEGGPGKELMGRRAKRAMKREAADKAAAAKHQQHLIRLGRQ